MAYGTELWLGWGGGPERWGNIAKELQLEFEEPLEELGPNSYLDIETWPEDSAAALKEAHRLSLEAAGFTRLSKPSVARRVVDYPCYRTPVGEREFSPFAIDVLCDPGELGMELKDAVLGVALSGRYFPTYLDWRDAHGTLDFCELNEATMKMIGYARLHIEHVLPVFKSANLVIVTQHY